MSEETKKTETPVTPPPTPPPVKKEETKRELEINWEKAEAYLVEIEEYQLQKDKDGKHVFAGKPGYNPYLWLTQNLNPLKHRFLNGERTPELYIKIMALKKVEPDGKSLKRESIKFSGPYGQS